jgi:hypothetical protein
VPPIPRIAIIGPIALGPALIKGLVLGVVLALAGVAARRSQQGALLRLVLVAAGAVLVPILVLARGPDEVRLGPTYQVTSLIAVGGLVVLTLVAASWSIVAPVARRIDPRALAGSALGVVGIGALAIAVLGGPTHGADAERTRAVADAIRHELPKGTYKLQATGSWAYLSTLDAVSVELLRHGYDVRIVRLGPIPDEPVRRDTDVDAPTIMLDSSGAPRTDGRLIVRRPALPGDPTWARELLDAVSDPAVRVAVRGPGAWEMHDDTCIRDVQTVADDLPARDDQAAQNRWRRRLALAVLQCSQTERRKLAELVSWSGLDDFWVDMLGSNMPAPFPRSPIAAYLIPPISAG